MVLPSSGPLSFTAIVGEFGGIVPHSLSEYYNKATGIPVSGTIKFSDFYGKSNNPLAPTWQTAATLASKANNTSFSYNLQATSDSAIMGYAITMSPGFGALSSLLPDKTVNLTGTTPGTGGTYSWTITATDSENQSTPRTFSLYVSSIFPTWQTGSTLASKGINTSFSYNLQATSDSAITGYAITSTPGFGSLSSLLANATVNLTGTTPGTTGTYSWTVRSTDSENQSTSRTFSLSVTSISPTWQSPNAGLGPFLRNQTLDFTLSATSDSAVTYSIVSGSVSTGLSASIINTSTLRILTGSAGGGGLRCTVRARDAESQTADRAFTLSVYYPPQVTSSIQAVYLGNVVDITSTNYQLSIDAYPAVAQYYDATNIDPTYAGVTVSVNSTGYATITSPRLYGVTNIVYFKVQCVNDMGIYGFNYRTQTFRVDFTFT